MAKLTSEQERKVRNIVEVRSNAANVPQTWSKSVINLAAQAADDVARGIRKIGAGKQTKQISDIMDDGIELAAPGVFDDTAKTWLREAVQTVVGTI